MASKFHVKAGTQVLVSDKREGKPEWGAFYVLTVKDSDPIIQATVNEQYIIDKESEMGEIQNIVADYTKVKWKESTYHHKPRERDNGSQTTLTPLVEERSGIEQVLYKIAATLEDISNTLVRMTGRG